ncbi:MAG: hypothetical protein LBU40_06130, partial [Methanobrevibacter sp.]|nr:hypothetical protein [Methanobrevibacter sp.]
IVIVYRATKKEIKENGLTGENISIYIKTKKELDTINSIYDFINNNIFNIKNKVLLRVSAECRFGSFGDSHCDCENQKISVLNKINEFGDGIYIDAPQEAQGNGLFYKAKELNLQVNGYNQCGINIGKKSIINASKYLLKNEILDKRKYLFLTKIFDMLNLNKYKYILIASNFQKVELIQKNIGAEIVEFIDVNKKMDINNLAEFLAKIIYKNYKINDIEIKEMMNIINSENKIPKRIIDLLEELKIKSNQRNENSDLIKRLIISIENKQKQINYNQTKKEFHINIELTVKEFEKLITNNLFNGITKIAYEENYYYEMSKLMSSFTNQIKIRKTNVLFENKKEFNLIFKEKNNNENGFNIGAVKFFDESIANLLIELFSNNKLSFLPVFSAFISHKYNKDTLILFKSYSNKFNMISIMTNDKSILEKIKKEIGDIIDIKTIVDPVEFNSSNKNIALNFDYDAVKIKHEKLFNKYKIIQL